MNIPGQGQETAKLDMHSSSCINQQVWNLSIEKSRIPTCKLGLQVFPSQKYQNSAVVAFNRSEAA